MLTDGEVVELIVELLPSGGRILDVGCGGGHITTAQISLYPLRQMSIGPAIRKTIRILRQHGLQPHVGEMSTLIWGEEQVVFDALQDAFHQAAEGGDTVMVVTLSNACPSPEEP